QRAGPGLLPAVFDLRELTFSAHNGPKENSCSTGPLSEDLVVVDRPRNAFHRLRFHTLQLEVLTREPFDGSRDHNPAGRGEAGDPGCHVRGQTVYIILFEIEVDHTSVHADADLDGEPETLLYSLTEGRDFPRHVQTRMHGPSYVVLVRSRMAENDQQSVAL